MMRAFRSPIARAAWLNFLVANERLDAAAALGWTEEGRGPSLVSAKQIEQAWRELEAAMAIQSYARARLAARLYSERMRKLRLFRLYARAESRAALQLQWAAKRLLARREAQRKWRTALNTMAPDPNEIAARLARAAALVQYRLRIARRSTLVSELRGTLYELSRRPRGVPFFRRFMERYVYATDGPEGAAICWQPSSSARRSSRAAPTDAPEQRVPIASIVELAVHSEVRYEFILRSSVRARAWLLRATAQHEMEQWLRHLHELVALEHEIAAAPSVSEDSLGPASPTGSVKYDANYVTLT